METLLGIDYATWWFLILGAAITGYAILDGFDLGVGALHLFLPKEKDRRISLNAIGPVWDGNEVWLVITGGVMFAAFPPVYASLFSGFYIPFMLFLVMIIFRATSIEFRSKEPMGWWRKMWDIGFAVSSMILGLALGMVLGNVLQGVPVGENGDFVRGTGFHFVNPFSVLVGLSTLALFALHGALYLMMKTEGQLYKRLMQLTRAATIIFVLLFVILTVYTLLYQPHLSDRLREQPALFILPVLMILLVANITRQVAHQNYGWAFASSAGVLATLLLLVAFELYPVMVPSTINEAYSLTVENSSASSKSMGIMLVIAIIAIPLIGAYTGFVFWTFRGKVKLDEESY